MKSIKLKSCLLALVSLALASCSDGAFKFNTPPSESESPAKPVIVSFKADPENIQSGEKTTLSYDVSGADEIIITGTSIDGKFNFSSDVLKEATGTVQVDGIPSTTTFVLQAKKIAAVAEEKPADDAKKQLAPGGTPTTPGDNPINVPASDAISTAEATVTVEGAQELSVELLSDRKEVEAGSPALITWEATPADASVTITASNGELIAPVTDCADLQTAQEAVAEETMPSLGCAVVTPTAPSTTYTAVATDAEGNTSEPAIVEIMVADNAPELSVELTVNGKSEDLVSRTADASNYPAFVKWEVNYDDAQVSITTDSPVVSCDIELPNGQLASDLQQARDNGHKCVVTVPTTFTITATRGEEVKTAIAKVIFETQPVSGIAKLNIVSSTGWAFVGESVSLNIAPADAASKAALKQVIVQGAESTTVDLSSGAQTVSAVAGKDGITVTSISLDGNEWSKHVVAGIDATVQSFSNAGGVTESAVSSLALDPANASTLYRGMQLAGYSGGKVRVYKGSSALDIDVKGPLNGTEATDEFLTAVGEYPVSAIAVREGKSDEVFMGTTGALFRSTDGGASFKAIQTLTLGRGSSGAKSSFPSCKGKEQKGVSMGKYSTLGRVCDVIADSSRLVFATNGGVWSLDNLDGADFSKPAKYNWFHQDGVATISHDLEKVNDKYMVATSAGVFSSSDATAWEACGATSGEIYALEYDSTRHELLAGGVDGNIYASSDDCKTWVQKGSVGGPVFDIAVDEQSASDMRSILVGTSTGGYVTRDSGKTFSAIPGLGEASVEAVELAAINDGKGATDYVIAVGSSVGTISSNGHVLRTTQPDVCATSPEAPGCFHPDAPAEPTTPSTEPEDTPLAE